MITPISVFRDSRTNQIIVTHPELQTPLELGNDYPAGTVRALGDFAKKNVKIEPNGNNITLIFGREARQLTKSAMIVRGASLIADRLKRHALAL